MVHHLSRATALLLVGSLTLLVAHVALAIPSIPVSPLSPVVPYAALAVAVLVNVGTALALFGPEVE